ncbi:MAG: hypothetical protein JNK56_18345 [Myxococcales bacterium]|nr:hypothetical protein [Myxococcales bacterium]
MVAQAHDLVAVEDGEQLIKEGVAVREVAGVAGETTDDHVAALHLVAVTELVPQALIEAVEQRISGVAHDLRAQVCARFAGAPIAGGRGPRG